MADKSNQEYGAAPDARLAALIGRVLVDIAEADRPAVIAMAERIAGDRYRAWADQVSDANAKTSLLECAAREDEIASKVEAIVPNAEAIQAKVSSAHPHIADEYKALFAGMPLAEQFAFQARAERAGAALWQSTAASATAVKTADGPIYLECAALEEASAGALDALILSGVAA